MKHDNMDLNAVVFKAVAILKAGGIKHFHVFAANEKEDGGIEVTAQADIEGKPAVAFAESLISEESFIDACNAVLEHWRMKGKLKNDATRN